MGLSIATLVALRRDRDREHSGSSYPCGRPPGPRWPSRRASCSRSRWPGSGSSRWRSRSSMAIAAIRPWWLPADRRWGGLLFSAIGGRRRSGHDPRDGVAPTPATHPSECHRWLRSTCRPNTSDRIDAGDLRFDSEVMVQTGDGSLMVRIAPLTISIQPFLCFLSRSPDGSPDGPGPRRRA